MVTEHNDDLMADIPQVSMDDIPTVTMDDLPPLAPGEPPFGAPRQERPPERTQSPQGQYTQPQWQYMPPQGQDALREKPARGWVGMLVAGWVLTGITSMLFLFMLIVLGEVEAVFGMAFMGVWVSPAGIIFGALLWKRRAASGSAMLVLSVAFTAAFIVALAVCAPAVF